MTMIQPDLFGEFDQREADALRDSQPQTCPACGTVEPNMYLLRISHGLWLGEPGSDFAAGQHPIYGAMCTAQYLVKNHITYYLSQEGNHDEALAERMERGRALDLDVEEIARQTKKKLRENTP